MPIVFNGNPTLTVCLLAFHLFTRNRFKLLVVEGKKQTTKYNAMIIYLLLLHLHQEQDHYQRGLGAMFCSDEELKDSKRGDEDRTCVCLCVGGKETEGR